MGIQQNVVASDAAKLLVELIKEEANNHEVALQRFYQVILDHIPKVYLPKVEKPKKQQPMSKREVYVFEKKEFPFGKYKGILIGNVPLSYLLWLEEENRFNLELHRYLLSDDIQKEQDRLVEVD
jgi:uncharacterized protein (DUF3820 family)